VCNPSTLWICKSLTSARPTNTQIRHLEDENAELRNSLSKLRSRLNQVEQSISASGGGHTIHGQPTSQVSCLAQPALQAAATTPLIPRQNQPCYSTGDREVQFHGPSSAMFDESHQPTTNPSNHTVSIEPTKKYELLGSCIKQRMLHHRTADF
jgi:hypothetical protein